MPNGKPASYIKDWGTGIEEEHYTSDELGRITKVFDEQNKTEFSYSSDQASSISYRLEDNNNWRPQTKTIITYTDEGFISDRYSYLLEDKFEDEPSWTLIYRFDSEGRLKEYEYENGDLRVFEYIEGDYSKIDYHGYSRKPYSKEDHLFNETDNILKYSLYFWSNEKWSLNYTDEYTYYNAPTSNIEITESTKVYGSEGHVIIESDIPTTVFVYSVSGSLIKQISVGTGINQIPMTSGIYIVSVKDKSYKVLVK